MKKIDNFQKEYNGFFNKVSAFQKELGGTTLRDFLFFWGTDQMVDSSIISEIDEHIIPNKFIGDCLFSCEDFLFTDFYSFNRRFFCNEYLEVSRKKILWEKFLEFCLWVYKITFKSIKQHKGLMTDNFIRSAPSFSDLRILMMKVKKKDYRDFLILNVIAHTKIRISEVLSLGIDELDLKNHKIRGESIPPILAEKLNEHVENKKLSSIAYTAGSKVIRSNSGLLFSTKNEKPLTRSRLNFMCVFMAKKTGIYISPDFIRDICSVYKRHGFKESLLNM